MFGCFVEPSSGVANVERDDAYAACLWNLWLAKLHKFRAKGSLYVAGLATTDLLTVQKQNTVF